MSDGTAKMMAAFLGGSYFTCCQCKKSHPQLNGDRKSVV